ncbi:MAG: ribonuclease HII, partial [Deltaproteobacteria bacterium]
MAESRKLWNMAKRPSQSSLFPEDPRDPWYFERRAHQRNFRRIAGVDEAGRGPLAGPVVAAAVVLPYEIDLPNVRDSKQLSLSQREACYEKICSVAADIGVGEVSAAEIDRTNILAASLKAMHKAVSQMESLPDFLL